MAKRKYLDENELGEMGENISSSDDEMQDFSSDDSVKDPERIISSDDDGDEPVHVNIEELVEVLIMAEKEEEFENTDENLVDSVGVEQPKKKEIVGSSSEPVEWNVYKGCQKKFKFTGKSGLQIDLTNTITAFETFSLFFDEEVISLIVTETNKYASQIIQNTKQSRYCRLNKWVPVTSDEIRKFFGLFMWMGLVRLGSLNCYWSTRSIYKNDLARNIMSRNRFELILRLIHFSDNESLIPGDRLGKIQPLIDILQIRFQKYYFPSEDYVIDETLVPWRGRLIFRQYIPNKAQKYGIKLFKLCSTEGYTWASQIYSSKLENYGRSIDLAAKVCEELSQGLLNQGRTLYVDNFYTTYPLALSFLRQKTHVVGTLRPSKKYLPKEVVDSKLSKGQMIAKEDENGIVVLNWRDISDFRILSTKHAPEMVSVHEASTSTRKRRESKQKPSAVEAYNKIKTGVDVSNQMGSYASILRKGIKWYRKLAIEYILGITVVNAYVLYKSATGKNLNIQSFREDLTTDMLQLSSHRNRRDNPKSNTHILTTKLNANMKKVRRMCVICYAKLKETEGRDAARKKGKKVSTYCADCQSQPFMCLECFGQNHT